MLPLSIKIYNYDLKGLKPLNRSESTVSNQEGCIIGCEWKPGQFGYADICPKPFFKDAPLSFQMEGLLLDQPSDLVKNAMTLSMLDAQARSNDTDLLASGFMLRNHKLISSLDELTIESLKAIEKEGFKVIKIKSDLATAQNIETIEQLSAGSNLLWRFDFNNLLSFEQAKAFLSQLSAEAKSKIQFVEDICNYNDEEWSHLQSFGVKLAIDNCALDIDFENLAADVMVLKPGRYNIIERLKKVKSKNLHFVVTHSMDHPFGILSAMAMAIKLQFFIKDKLMDCGFLPGEQFEWDAHFQPFEVKGPHIVPKEDIGFGSSSDLEKLPWKILNA